MNTIIIIFISLLTSAGSLLIFMHFFNRIISSIVEGLQQNQKTTAQATEKLSEIVYQVVKDSKEKDYKIADTLLSGLLAKSLEEYATHKIYMDAARNNEPEPIQEDPILRPAPKTNASNEMRKARERNKPLETTPADDPALN